MTDRQIFHLLDDMAVGGVTRALSNFEDPLLQQLGLHRYCDIREEIPRARSMSDIAIVHFTMSWAKLARLAEIRLRGRFKRLCLIEHTYTEGFEAACVEHPFRFRAMLRQAYRQVDTVIAVSREQAHWLQKNKLVPAHKLEVIPQARDVTELLSVPALPMHRPGPLRIGAFGRFDRQKGFDLLIEAMTQISPETATLKIAGYGDGDAQLRSLSQGLANVSIEPPFKSPRAFLQSVDAVAIPSRWEAFGLVGSEARAAARPIIVSAVDGLKDQASDHAFVHAAGDVTAMVAAIEAAAKDNGLRQRGLRARAKVTCEYDRMIFAWRDLLTGKQPALCA
ncbi:MAG: glycosyl transferase [Henriciella sp.]|uniref:glycosyltransferase family 4 protein n=1 Tax=Henriciella sp. TaxID=1968823 RepID=UPI000C0EE2C0|nr:glycosyltransferase family 4 protein [Henriciella sp.]MAN74731.1 glycosyl transferase [Henriciella sp.]MBF32867.1 glycosyl transferase [Hyphomonadaceae bacterium]MBK75634.1 glycosyl transferase [Henriciella sp.]PHR75874.1 MAG: glycosyl transferase [Henriciella sp.]|tara:strand:- start:543 stop:1550 length:1008 start_codon:yes stop_codon:yes gene_type:complete